MLRDQNRRTKRVKSCFIEDRATQGSLGVQQVPSSSNDCSPPRSTCSPRTSDEWRVNFVW